MTAPRHFLTLMDLASDEIRALIARAIELKAQHRAGTEILTTFRANTGIHPLRNETAPMERALSSSA